MQGRVTLRTALGLTFALSVGVLLTGCATAPVSPPLVQKLAATPGQFEWRAAQKRHVFTNKAGIGKLLEGMSADDAVRVLVECLDDAAPAAATLSGRPVPVGVVCYEALSQTAYYEATDAAGDTARSWPGHVSADASPAALREAKKAWLRVVRERAYKLL